MKLIKFAEAKKAPKKLQRSTRSATKAVRSVKNAVTRGGVKKALVWDSIGMSVDDVNKKMQAFGEKVKAKRKALSSKNQTYIANKKIDKTVDDFNKAVQAPTPGKKSYPVNQPPLKMDIELNGKQRDVVENKLRESVETVKSPSKQLLKPKGVGMKTKLGIVTLATAGVVGSGVAGYGLYRKMRSDKGKKRGSYKNFNFPGELVTFGYEDY